jgi:hypothetical protein
MESVPATVAPRFPDQDRKKRKGRDAGGLLETSSMRDICIVESSSAGGNDDAGS